MALIDSKVVHTDSGSTVTLTGIVPSGTNKYGTVKVGWFSTATMTSVVWGGVDITANLIKTASHDGLGRKNLVWFYYKEPPASSANVVITLSGSTAISAIAEAWSDVDQTTPYTNLTVTADATAQTADPSTLAVTSTSGKTITDSFFMWTSGSSGTTNTLGGSQTLIQGAFRNFGGGASTGYFGTSYATSTGSDTMSWDVNNTGTLNWAMYAIALTPASAGVVTESVPARTIRHR